MSPHLRLALRWTLAALAFTLLVLLATGVWLIWYYRPSPIAPWAIDRHLTATVEWTRRVQLLHRWAGVQLIVLGLALSVEGAVWAASTHRFRRAAIGLAALVAVLFADFCGFLIAWDQLALFAVKVGTDMRGFGPTFSNQTRYVLVGTAEINLDTFHRWFWVHTVAIPLAVFGIVGMMLVMLRRVRPAIGSPAGSAADEIRRTSWRSRS